MGPNAEEATLPVCTSWSLRERPEDWQERRSGWHKEKVDEAEKMWKENLWVKKQKIGCRGGECNAWLCMSVISDNLCKAFLFAPEQPGGVAINKLALFIFFCLLDFLEATTVSIPLPWTEPNSFSAAIIDHTGADLAAGEFVDGLSEHKAKSYFCLEFIH